MSPAVLELGLRQSGSRDERFWAKITVEIETRLTGWLGAAPGRLVEERERIYGGEAAADILSEFWATEGQFVRHHHPQPRRPQIPALTI